MQNTLAHNKGLLKVPGNKKHRLSYHISRIFLVPMETPLRIGLHLYPTWVNPFQQLCTHSPASPKCQDIGTHSWALPLLSCCHPEQLSGVTQKGFMPVSLSCRTGMAEPSYHTNPPKNMKSDPTKPGIPLWVMPIGERWLLPLPCSHPGWRGDKSLLTCHAPWSATDPPSTQALFLPAFLVQFSCRVILSSPLRTPIHPSEGGRHLSAYKAWLRGLNRGPS